MNTEQICAMLDKILSKANFGITIGQREAVVEAKKALEKQTPNREKHGEMYWCGNCKAQPIYDDDLYCALCGQRLND